MTPTEPNHPATSKAAQIGEFFADLPPNELEALAPMIIALELDADTGITTVDDYATAVYFIQEGEAGVVTDTGETGTVGPGDTFGEIALLLTGQRTATVTARTPMRLLVLSGQDFERIRDSVPVLEQSLRRLSLERATTQPGS
ncbi:MAG TPA: cyclic nucleotide-binding domain-containing protein [Gaiellaceae bacterium]|jgi:CRP-like cAMP-binding protein|nr:cyclic nucleotide-binding domain-containing protein [Gaiellaceae bacterium]